MPVKSDNRSDNDQRREGRLSDDEQRRFDDIQRNYGQTASGRSGHYDRAGSEHQPHGSTMPHRNGAGQGSTEDDLNDSEQAAAEKPQYAGAPSSVLQGYQQDALGRGGQGGGAATGPGPKHEDQNSLTGDTGRGAPGDTGRQSGGTQTAGQDGKAGAGGAAAGGKAGGGGTGTGLQKQEQDAADKGPSIINAPAPKGKGIFGRLKGMSRRRRLVIGSVAGTMVFGGGGLGLVGIIAGPGQLIHAAQLLQQFHLDEKGRQGQHRTVLTIRNIRYIVKGEPQKTRMGYLGNKIADKVEAKFNANGIESVYSGPRGVFRGYLIDAELLRGIDYDGIKDRSPAGVQKYLKDKFNIEATINSDGRTLSVSTRGMTYAQEAKLVRSTMKLAGYDGKIAGLMGRPMMTRNDIDRHPIKKLTGASRESRYEQWKKRMVDKVRRGIRPFTLSAGTNQEDPNDVARNGVQQADDFAEEINQAAADFADGKAGALDRLRAHIGTRFSGGATDIVGIVCGALAFFENIDQLNYVNVIKPMQQLGGNAVTVGNQAMTSHEDNNEEEFGHHHDMMTDRINKTHFFDGRSIRAELGKPLSGSDIPASAKVDPGGHIISRTIGAIPGARDTCQVVNSTAGQIALTGISLVLTGGINTLISTVVGIGAQELFIDEMTKAFAAAAVPALPEGEPYGNFANYGVRFLARDYAATMGGLPISDQEDQNLGALERELQDEEFQGRSLAQRLFDTKDARSFVAQVIDGQTTDPGTNIARATTNFLNVSKNLSTVASAPFSRTLHAAPLRTDYNYGFPDYAYTLTEMNDERYNNPFQNADMASDILDASVAAAASDSPDNLAFRAKKCFGVSIERGFIQDRPAWTVMPPVSGATPLQKDILDPANKCFGEGVTAINTPRGIELIRRTAVTDENWNRVRFYIADSAAMNALACDESIGDDPDLTKACTDIGQEGAGGGVAATVPAGGAPGQTKQEGQGYTLNNGTDYTGTPCPGGTVETRIYEHPTEKFRIRVCRIGETGAELASIAAEKAIAMVNAAKGAGITLRGSGWRSYERQIELRRENGCTQVMGPSSNGCNPDTAVPGNSEHERGLAFDFTKGGRLQAGTPEFNWLKANSAQYGFYNYPRESWHWSTSGT